MFRTAEARSLVLAALSESEHWGRDLRDMLAERGFKYRSVPFYALMAGMEDDELVIGFWADHDVLGQNIPQRRYRIVPGGRRSYESTEELLAARLGLA